MKFRSTLILLTLALGLGFFIWKFERHSAGTRHSDKGQPLLSVVATDVDSMEIKNLGGTTKLKKKPDGAWFLTEPIDDRADPALIKEILRLAGETVVVESLTEEESRDASLTNYGLDDANAMRVALRAGGKTIQRLKIGLEGPSPDMMYALVGDSKPQQIRVVEPNLRSVLGKTAAEMRDPWVFRQRPGTVERAAWRRGEREIEIGRQLLGNDQATPWMVVKPMKTRALQKELDQYVAMLAGTTVEAFAPANANQQPSSTPLAELTLWGMKQEKGSTIRFFPDPEAEKVRAPVIGDEEPHMEDRTVLAWIVERQTLVRLDSDRLYSLPDNLNLVRAHTLTDLNYESVNTILIEGALAKEEGRAISLRRVRKRWFLDGEGKTFIGANSSKVARLIKDLNAAEMLDFTTDTMVNPGDYGLENPLFSVTFSSAESTSLTDLAQPTPENSVVLRLGQGVDGKLYANFVGEPSVYLMAPEHLYGLIDHRWIKWRSLTVGNFARNSVRKLVVSLGVEPPLELTAPRRSLEFSATRGGGDVTPLLNQLTIEHLLGKLANFQASEWAVGLQEGMEALRDPLLQIELELEDWNPDKGEFISRRVKYTFAPTVKNVEKPLAYFARSSELAELFIVNRDVFLELSQPLLDPQKQDPNQP